MKKIFSVFIVVVICLTSLSALGITALGANQTGTVNCDALNVRSGAGTSYSKIAVLYNGETVTVTGSATDSSGDKWYKISFTYSGASKTGYVYADYITISSSSGSSGSGSSSSTSDAAFEKYMTAQGFPDSYKPMLRTLHAKYPNWIFTAQHLGIDWYDALEEELVLGRNLVHAGAPASWKSMEKGAYNFSGGYWYGLDGSWVAASKEIIAYYLDPRNFINDPSIFMFENLSYNSAVHNIKGVKNILSGTFMSGNFTAPDTNKTYSYAQTFMDAAAKSGVSPYHLAARCRNEQGVKGAPQSLGTVAGYENYFNFFNIHAYATSTMTAAEMGCKYASTTNATYLLPWTNQYKAIVGGSIFVGNGYINKEQDTLYLQKFDVVDGGNGYYYHQYMTCVFGQENEAASLKKAYTTDMLNSAMEFKIPVYENMPTTVYSKPTSTGDNNNFLKSLSVSGYSLNERFDKYTMSYTLSQEVSDSYVTITAPALRSGATVSGAGKVALNVGTNKVKINVTAPSGVVRTYTITIVRKADSTHIDSVSNLKAEVDRGTVKLSWDKVSDAVGYIVFQYDTSAKAYKRIGKIAENTGSYTVSDLNPGTHYRFAIKAYKFYNNTAYYSSYSAVSAFTQLEAVAGLKVESATSDTVKLSWDKLSGATGYIVYRYDANKGSWVRVQKLTNNSCSVSGLSSATQYKFAVEAYKTFRSTSWVYSENKVSVSKATKLPKVTGLKVEAKSKSSIRLTWDKISNANGYIVYRYDDKSESWIRAGKVTGNVYSVKGLESGTEYKFCVRGYKSLSSTSWVYSDGFYTITAATNEVPLTELPVVENLNAAADGSVVTLTWDKCSKADGYIIYRYDSSAKDYVRVARIAENTDTYTISGLTVNTSYKFAVKAFKFVNGNPIYSKDYAVISTVTKLTKLPTVTNLKATANITTVKLTWDKQSEAEGYIIFRYDSAKKAYVRVKKLTTNTNSYTVSGMSADTSYKFAVKAYSFVDEVPIYSEDYCAVSVKTNKSAIEII